MIFGPFTPKHSAQKHALAHGHPITFPAIVGFKFGPHTMRRVTVAVPATTANLGPGFDCLGLALDVWNTVTVEAAEVPGQFRVANLFESLLHSRRFSPGVGGASDG